MFFHTPPIVLRMEEAFSHADHTVRVLASARVGSPLNQMKATFALHSTPIILIDLNNTTGNTDMSYNLVT